MSIYIKGMEVPKTCWECINKYHLVHDVKCTIYDKLYRYRHRLMNINDPILRERRAEGCPLVEVSIPHGDLIDRDTLKDACESLIEEPLSVALAYTNQYIDVATTIIEAED